MYEQPTAGKELNPTQAEIALEGVGFLVTEELRALRQRGGTTDEAVRHVETIVRERLEKTGLFDK